MDFLRLCNADVAGVAYLIYSRLINKIDIYDPQDKKRIQGSKISLVFAALFAFVGVGVAAASVVTVGYAGIKSVITGEILFPVYDINGNKYFSAYEVPLYDIDGNEYFQTSKKTKLFDRDVYDSNGNALSVEKCFIDENGYFYYDETSSLSYNENDDFYYDSNGKKYYNKYYNVYWTENAVIMSKEGKYSYTVFDESNK